MRKTVQEALEEAMERLEKARPEIERRQKKVSEKRLEEPDHLRSGAPIDELEFQRILKEQENDDPLA